MLTASVQFSCSTSFSQF